jgi:hypothetical protein
VSSTAPDRPPSLLRRLRRVLRTGYWLKIIVWLFLPGFGALCLKNGLLGPAALLGVLGLGLGLRLAWVLYGWRRRVLLGLCAFQLILLVASLWLLARPLRGGWQRLPNTAGWSDPTLLLTGDGVLVVVTSSPKGSFWSDDGGRTFRARGLPGHFGFVLADDARRGWVWMGTSQGELLNMYHRGKGRWLQLQRPPGHVWGLALSEDRIFMALGQGGLRVTSDRARGWMSVAEVDHCTGVATAPDDEERLLAVGRAWLASSNGGVTWSRVGSPAEARFAHPAVALGAGGWSYVYEGGMLSGTLAVTGPGTKGFEERRLPVSDARVLVADAEDGRLVWLGSWGQGVFRSRDAGQHWEDLGLQAIEVRSLVVDPRHHRLFAASSNLALRRGVYVRTVSP